VPAGGPALDVVSGIIVAPVGRQHGDSPEVAFCDADAVDLDLGVGWDQGTTLVVLERSGR
jgi:hypothetical protein